MTKRQFAMLALIALTWAAIDDCRPGGSLLAQSGRAPSAPVQQQQQRGLGSMTTIFEYRILHGTTSRLDSLESTVNQLAEQGYQVDIVRTDSRINGGYPALVSQDMSGKVSPLRPFEVSSETEIVVLMKRTKK
jgi:hypothetical protein